MTDIALPNDLSAIPPDPAGTEGADASLSAAVKQVITIHLNNIPLLTGLAPAVLQQLGLTGLMHRPAGQLSQGQKRRTALLHLRLLPFRPVWLLDEPFNSLDREARTTLSTWMNAHRAQGGALLFTNHKWSLNFFYN